MANVTVSLAESPYDETPERGGGFWRTLLRSPGGVVGLCIVILLVAVALSASWTAPFDPLQMGAGKRLSPPGGAHWFAPMNSAATCSAGWCSVHGSP